MLTLRQKLIWRALPIFILLLIYQMLIIEAYMKQTRIEEIPFGLTERERKQGDSKWASQRGIHVVTQIEKRRSFFHIFNVPYIVCFFAAKGKWPFIPPFMKVQVDSVSKTLFTQNDSYIKQFCQKWIQIKQCFRPIFEPTVATTASDVEIAERLRATPCTCSNAASLVYFDKKYIGKVNSDIIYNTIEFLEGFLPPPTKRVKNKNRVRSRLDEMDIKD